MAGYGLLQSSTLGMLSQSTAISNIGVNIANVTTGGYKATDINFQTLVGQTIDKQSDLGGVKPIRTQRIDRQGLLADLIAAAGVQQRVQALAGADAHVMVALGADIVVAFQVGAVEHRLALGTLAPQAVGHACAAIVALDTPDGGHDLV